MKPVFRGFDLEGTEEMQRKHLGCIGLTSRFSDELFGESLSLTNIIEIGKELEL